MSFLSAKWLRRKVADLGKEKSSYHIAIFMHLYLGAVTLEEMAKMAGITLESLRSLRTEPRFVKMVDTLKKEFSRDFRENLLINTYNPGEYESLAEDFTLLDEIVQTQIKVPLFTQLGELSQRLKSKKTHGLRIDTSELMLFMRLFSFFIFVEKYAPTLTSKALTDMKQFAEEVVWPGLNRNMKETDRLLGEPVLSRNERVKVLKQRLEDILMC